MSNTEAYYFAVDAARQLTPEDMRSLADYLVLLAADREQEIADETEHSASGYQSPR